MKLIKQTVQSTTGEQVIYIAQQEISLGDVCIAQSTDKHEAIRQCLQEVLYFEDKFNHLEQIGA